MALPPSPHETTKRAFLVGIDRQFDISRMSKKDSMPQVTVRDNQGNIHLADRDDFLVDNEGVTIANEFLITWKGIRVLKEGEDALYIILNDNSSIEVEACPF